MSIKIANDTANGSITLKGQNVAGDKTITMPNLDCELAPRMQLMTAQNSTSGTSIDFTGIPSWAKRITVMFNGVSTSGTSSMQVQIGTGGVIQSTGYSWLGVYTGGTNQSGNNAAITSGFGIDNGTAVPATATRNGAIEILNISSNTYVGRYVGSAYLFSSIGSGNKTLSGALDIIRITTVNYTDTFDAGQINVLYEG